MLVSQSIFACATILIKNVFVSLKPEKINRSIVQRSIVQGSVEKRLMGKELLQLSNAVKENI